MNTESIKRLAEIDKELMILRKQIKHYAQSNIYDDFRFSEIVIPPMITDGSQLK